MKLQRMIEESKKQKEKEKRRRRRRKKRKEQKEEEEDRRVQGTKTTKTGSLTIWEKGKGKRGCVRSNLSIVLSKFEIIG
jgi:hypothetical protein